MITITTADFVAIISVIGVIFSVYVALVIRIQILEVTDRDIRIDLQLTKERSEARAEIITNIQTDTTRINQVLLLHIQQVVSDKEAVNLYNKNLSDLLTKRDEEYKSNDTNLYTKINADITKLNNVTLTALQNIDSKLGHITKFLIKTTDFNNDEPKNKVQALPLLQ